VAPARGADTTDWDLQRKSRKESGDRVESDFLFLAFDCERPLGPTSRHSLSGIDTVKIGRANERTAHRGSERTLILGLADRWVSGTHASLHRVLDGWVIEDRGSRNGTFLNGRKIERAELGDGDLIETGHTFFLFRSDLVDDPANLDAVGATDAAAFPLGLQTLLPEVAAQFERLERVAPSEVPIIVLGETGTGKELIARAIHALSQRPGPFVAVNCAALVPTLLESELFGHRKGAFSGATEDRIGLVRAADHGTLFLDEIGDLPAAAQATLLRTLQEREVLPVGSIKPIKVDIRVVSATHRDLASMVAGETFRADLLARISGFTVELPPLRDRREDLGLLVASILRRHVDPAREPRFTCDAVRALLDHGFPLNVRELEKAIVTAISLAGDGPIEVNHLPKSLQGTHGPLEGEDVERREELVALLKEHRGNVAAVARQMGKARMQIHRWIARYGLELEAFRR